MGRANAIVVGSAVLAPLILGVEGYIVFRPHQRPRAAEVADVPAAAAPIPFRWPHLRSRRRRLSRPRRAGPAASR